MTLDASLAINLIFRFITCPNIRSQPARFRTRPLELWRFPPHPTLMPPPLALSTVPVTPKVEVRISKQFTQA